jgi:hypothetical protein
MSWNAISNGLGFPAKGQQWAVNSGVPIVWKTKGAASAARDAFRLVLQHGRDRIKQPPRSGIHRKPRGIDDG